MPTMASRDRAARRSRTRLRTPLPPIALLVAVAQLERFVLAGRRAGGHRGAAEHARGELHVDLDGGIAARIEDLAGANGDDLGHGDAPWLRGEQTVITPAAVGQVTLAPLDSDGGVINLRFALVNTRRNDHVGSLDPVQRDGPSAAGSRLALRRLRPAAERVNGFTPAVDVVEDDQKFELLRRPAGRRARPISTSRSRRTC